MTRFLAVPLLIFAMAVLGGCQTGGTKKNAGAAPPASGAGSIEARAAQRWAYLIEAKAEKAYDYLSPGFRKSMSREQYAASKNAVALKWQRASVSKKECQEDVCEVFILLDYLVNLPNAGGGATQAFAPIREKWVKSGKQWYFLPEK